MSFDDTDLIERLHTVAERFAMPAAPLADDVRRGRQRVRRNRGLVAGAVAAGVAVVLGVTAVVGGQGRAGSDGLGPVERPGVVENAAPVWWDANGLHRGDVVEQTPVDLGGVNGEGALALVRAGALYLDPATGEVWFHPWGGHPRIVGHDSEAGPGGDPNGNTAAWFEGSNATSGGPGELVVYDTAARSVISRTLQSHGVTNWPSEHHPPGNDFLQVSAERVVWKSQSRTYSHDVLTQTTSVVDVPKGLLLADVHDDVEVFGERGSFALVLRVPGQAEQRYPDLEWHARLSPNGNYVLTVEDTEEHHAAVILDTRTGELWRVPKDVYPWIAWSYGDLAMVNHTEDELLACDAARSACDRVPAEDPFLMPTS